eukprot:771956_1
MSTTDITTEGLIIEESEDESSEEWEIVAVDNFDTTSLEKLGVSESNNNTLDANVRNGELSRVPSVFGDVNHDDLLFGSICIINDGPYSVDEERETGWILKNITNEMIQVKAKLMNIDSDSEIEFKFEQTMEFEVKPDDEAYIFVNVRAPPTPDQYHVFCSLVLHNNNDTKICDMLHLPISVHQPLDGAKENKIKQIQEMGFSQQRDTIIQCLKKWDWNVLKAVNWLAT